MGHPVALRLPGRRPRPALQDGRRGHGPDQGHDPVSDRVDDQEAMGVIDPLDTKVTSPQGARQADHPPRRHREGPRRVHHRQPDQGPTPSQRIRPRPRAEADLRRGDQGRALDPVRRLDRDQPAEGSTPPSSARSSSTTTRSTSNRATRRAKSSTSSGKDSAGPLDDGGPRARPQEVNPDKMKTLTDALADLKIVGVRPKPAGLTRDLKRSNQKGITLSASHRRLAPEQGLLHDPRRPAPLEPGGRPRLQRRGRRLHPPVRRGHLRHGRRTRSRRARRRREERRRRREAGRAQEEGRRDGREPLRDGHRLVRPHPHPRAQGRGSPSQRPPKASFPPT